MAEYVPQLTRSSGPEVPVLRTARSPTTRPLFVRQSAGLQTVKRATARPLRNDTPAPCGSSGRKLKYHVGSWQSLQTPKRGPQAARTWSRVAPSARPPRVLPGTTTPARGGAAAALAVATRAARATKRPRIGYFDGEEKAGR